MLRSLFADIEELRRADGSSSDIPLDDVSVAGESVSIATPMSSKLNWSFVARSCSWSGACWVCVVHSHVCVGSGCAFRQRRGWVWRRLEARGWLFGTLFVTVGGSPRPSRLRRRRRHPRVAHSAGLLFVGSSVHVCGDRMAHRDPRGTRMLCEYRSAPFGRTQPGCWGSGRSWCDPPRSLEWLLPGVLAWQFLHFQKQNLGPAALAASSYGAESPRPRERAASSLRAGRDTCDRRPPPTRRPFNRSPVSASWFPPAAVFVMAVFAGGRAARRDRDQRPGPFAAMYAAALAFWLPVFAFHGPYAAVGGLVIAHGLQYLLLTSLGSAGAPRTARRPLRSVRVRSSVLVGATVLSAAPHLHDTGPSTRWLYGAYVGVVASHLSWWTRALAPAR